MLLTRQGGVTCDCEDQGSRRALCRASVQPALANDVGRLSSAAPPRKFPHSRIVARPISPSRRYSLEGEPQDHTVTQSTDSPAKEIPDSSSRRPPTATHTYPILPCCSHTPPVRRSNACPELGETFRRPRVSPHCRHTTEAPPPPRPRPLPNAMSLQRLPCSPRPQLPHPPPQPAQYPAQHSTVKTRSSAMRSLCSHTASPSWTTASSARTVARSSTR
jgi:hypothetical protein